METPPFDKLSPELRNAIYELVVEDHAKDVAKPRHCTKIVPALAQTCSSIRKECLLMSFNNRTFNLRIKYAVQTRVHRPYYSVSRHDVTNFNLIINWLNVISPECHAVIGKLTLGVDIEDHLLGAVPREEWKQLMKLLKECGYTKDRLVFQPIRAYTTKQMRKFERLVEEDFEGMFAQRRKASRVRVRAVE